VTFGWHAGSIWNGSDSRGQRRRGVEDVEAIVEADGGTLMEDGVVSVGRCVHLQQWHP